jgi:putative aldouronate transport system substrate-binding protein
VDRSQVFPAAEIWGDAATAGELGTLQTNLQSYVNQGELAFITGTRNIDTDWDSWVRGLDGLGMKRFLQLNQQGYDKFKAAAK